MKKATKQTKKQPFSWRKIGKTFFYVLAACAWVYLCFYGSAYIASFIITRFWTPAQINASAPLFAFYEALVYVIDFLLVAFVPWLIYRIWRKKHHASTKNQHHGTTNEAKNETVTKTESSSNDHQSPLRPSRENLGLKNLPKWVDLGLAPVGFIIYIVLAAVLTAIFSNFSWFDATADQTVGYSTFLNGPDLLVAFLALVIVAPIFEELIFRGWLYHKLRLRLNIPLAAIIVSALFGFFHGQWNVAVNVFALSLVLCALRELTGTIYAGILLHMLKNGIAFYLTFILNY